MAHRGRGFRAPALEYVVDEKWENTQFRYTSNTGIIQAYDVNGAVARIRSNPIGLEL